MKKLINLFFIVIVLIIISNISNAQSLDEEKNPIAKGSWMFNGSFSLSSLGGDLYKSADDKRMLTIQFAPSGSYFINSNIAVGAKMTLNYTSQGNNSSSIIGIGPSFQFFVGGDKSSSKSTSKIHPFFGATVLIISGTNKNETNSYYGSKTTTTTLTGTVYSLGVGAIMMLNNNIGLVGELDYQIDNYNSGGSSKSGNQINVLGGIVAFIY